MGYSEDLDSAELAEKLHEQVRANDVLNRSITRQEEEIKKLKARIVKLEFLIILKHYSKSRTTII